MKDFRANPDIMEFILGLPHLYEEWENHKNELDKYDDEKEEWEEKEREFRREIRALHSEIDDLTENIERGSVQIRELQDIISDHEDLSFDSMVKQNLSDKMGTIIDLYPNEVQAFIDTFSHLIFD